MLKGVNINRVVFVDNLSSCFFLDLDLGVPIIPYNGEANDIELLSLAEFLVDLSRKDNFKEVVSKSFGLDCLMAIDSIGLAIEKYVEFHDKPE